MDENGIEINQSHINDRDNFWRFNKDVFTLHDYEKWLMPGHGSAQTVRNIIREKRDKLDYSIVYKASKRVGDRTHLLIDVVEGDIRCMNDVVTCYRYRTSGNNNYVAFQAQNNIWDEDYLMMVRLEQWALKNKNIRLNLDSTKIDRFVASVVIWMKNPTKENWKVIKNIVSYSKKPFRHFFYIIKIITLKEFYWKIKKMDKLIKL